MAAVQSTDQDRLPDLPAPVQDAMLAVGECVRSHPRHELPHRFRLQVYAAFGPVQSPERYRARAWLAILAAERALPVFRKAVPKEQADAEAVIAMAKRLVRGEATPDDGAVRRLSNEAYLAGTTPFLVEQELTRMKHMREECGHDPFASSEREDAALEEAARRSRPVDCAHHAAVWALNEAQGHEGLSRIDQLHVVLPQDGDGPVTILRGDDLDADLLAGHSGGDAAADAAVALAWDVDEQRFDPERLLDFWEWWLGEAILNAWEAAHESDG